MEPQDAQDTRAERTMEIMEFKYHLTCEEN